jgi:hypothetical protein
MTVWVLLVGCSASPGDSGDTAEPADTDRDTDTDTAVEVIDDTGGEDTDTDTDDTGPDDAAVYAAFFDASVVQRVDLSLSEEALAALRAAPEEWVEGSFSHGGYTVEKIGIRLKGNDENWEDIDGKPSFKLALDEFHDNRDYGGLRRINLENMKSDAVQGREVLAAALLEAAGIAAPRATFAEVYVNGVSHGLYANVEELDERFLERHFTAVDGDLWVADEEADLTPAGVENYELASGDGDFDALDLARREIQTGDGAFYDVADGVLDMARFLDAWAWQILLANEDGYPYDLDDHALYANPDTAGRFQYILEGLEETFDAEMEWDAYTGTVAVHCAYDSACETSFQNAMRSALTTWDALGPSAVTADVLAVSLTTLESDGRRALPLADVLTARAQLVSFTANRGATVRGQMGL